MSDLTIANEIANQLGGTNRICMMIGVKHFLADSDSLTIIFSKCKKADRVVITLTPMDTYRVEFFKMNKKTLSCPLTGEFDNVYNDQLKSLFENFTGLRLSL